jgi:hypothetical protein
MKEVEGIAAGEWVWRVEDNIGGCFLHPGNGRVYILSLRQLLHENKFPWGKPGGWKELHAS